MNLKKDLVEYESQRLKERVRELNDEQREQGASLINDMIVSGKLKTTISQKFSLEEVAEAHKTVEDAQHIGNVILEI